MLSKLALRNVKRQVGNYLIYFMTVAFTVAMLFSISNIIFSDSLLRFTAVNKEIYGALIGIVIFISAIVAFVLSYATSFMLKLRKREFGTYLTLGMTRRNILIIFLSETSIIGLLALGMGLVIGLFIYQGLSALMMRLLEMKFALSAYSPAGLMLTIGLVAGIFLLATLGSAVYLKRASIYELIHGTKHTKEVKHPLLWFLMTLFSLALIIGSLIFTSSDVQKIIVDGTSFNNTIAATMVFAASMVLFHIGMARSLVHLLLKRKGFCNRGSNTFVLRALSGTLGSNSIMLGFLAFLLTFAVIGTNVAFTQKTSQEEILKRTYPYDVTYADSEYLETSSNQDGNGIPRDKAEAIIRKYVNIESQLSYNAYTSGRNDFYSHTRWSGEGYEGLSDLFMKLSDFNALIEPLGYETVTLSDEYMVVTTAPELEKLDWNGVVFEQSGRTYRLRSVHGDYPAFLKFAYFYVVVPDEAVADMEKQREYTVYDTEDTPYDALALLDELTYRTSGNEMAMEQCDYTLREYGRQEQNSTNAIFVIGALFVAAVFLFMAMAILALKTISNLADDKNRYGILHRLGASKNVQNKTLFKQTFSFFVLPFAMPLLMSIPTAIICRQIMKSAGMAALMPQITVITVLTAVIMTVIYLLYYIVTYHVAKQAVVNPSF